MNRLFVCASLCLSSFVAHADEKHALETFRAIAKECNSIYFAGKAPRIHNRGSDGLWRKVAKEGIDVRFDVKRSDSLVSPFSGVIAVSSVTLVSGPQATEDAASEVVDLQKTTSSFDELRYVYRDGAWVSVGRSYTMDLFKNGQPEQRPMKMQFHGSEAWSGESDAAKCLRLARLEK